VCGVALFYLCNNLNYEWNVGMLLCNLGMLVCKKTTGFGLSVGFWVSADFGF